ncbi:cell division protein FtsZ [bacterium]|nr:cell division protein FtsZ [bacterium]
MSGKNSAVKIAVIGVGGGGCNAVAMMNDETGKDEKSIFKDSNVKIIAANTDAQVLEKLNRLDCLQLGPNLTKGQGAGGIPECGREAAEESKIDIATAFEGYDMVFVTAGMGGGTGTGAAPIIAGVARDAGILTVGIVTKPFSFEGKKKMKNAEKGIEELSKNVDALVVIPNDRLLEISSDDDDTLDMFKKPNEILIYAVRSISELIIRDGYVNVDFADVRATMRNMGIAVIGFGSATGDKAPLNAVKDALNNPLLNNFAISGSRKMLLYFSGARTKMQEFSEAVAYLTNQIDEENADFKFGIYYDENSTNVSVLIVTEAHEEKRVSLPKTHKIEEKDQSSIFDSQPVTVEKMSDIVIEVQNPTLLDEEAMAPAAKKNETVKPVDVNITETKTFSFADDTMLLPDIDINDKNIPAYLRKTKKSEFVQSSIQEYELQKK